ncbi:alpha/beta fold hydrolase [Streptomyces cyaneofuscatus]|uniref:alpha/beta fold hydrolase n=1 Tax=Streptomyces cyaneofuscatus TaxID=66883 RepID=UPI003650E092
MRGTANAHYECIKACSETDFTEDLKAIGVPVLVAYGTDDQIAPYDDSALLSAEPLKNGRLKSYDGLPHGMLTTHPEMLNPDLLAFIRE